VKRLKPTEKASPALVLPNVTVDDGVIVIRIPFQIMNRLAVPPVNDERDPRITKRQQEILDMVRRGWSNKDISVRTVKFHITNLLRKFGVEKRDGLVAICERLTTS
jgi:DNA-binding NarL/FixJ family response regulator